MREYNVSATGVTVASSSPMSLVMLMPASGQTIEILRMWASQNANATSNQQGIRWGWKASVYQSTMTATSPVAVKSSDPVSKLTGTATIAAGVSATGISTGTEGAGTFTVLGSDNFNVLNGWLWVPTPAETIMVNSASAYCFTLQFSAVPATTTNWTFGVTFRELG
jgi:hypothetical protein